MSQSSIPSSTGTTCLLYHLGSFPARALHHTTLQSPRSLELYIPLSSPTACSQSRARQYFQQQPSVPKHLTRVCSPTRMQTPSLGGVCYNTGYADVPQQGPNVPSMVWQLSNLTWCQAPSSPLRCPCSWPTTETTAAHTFLCSSNNQLKTKHFSLLPVQNAQQWPLTAKPSRKRGQELEL